MTPDAIVVFSAGTVLMESGGWRTTTYENTDAFGTMGGRDRVEAAAELAKRYPDACVVTTSKKMTGESTTLAKVYADELASLGVARKRILEEEESTTAGTQVQEALRLAAKMRWKKLLFLSSEFQLPRLAGFCEQIPHDAAVDFVSSESVLMKDDPAFAARFAKIKRTPEYQARLAAEARGLAALKAGTYRSAPPEDKRER